MVTPFFNFNIEERLRVSGSSVETGISDLYTDNKTDKYIDHDKTPTLEENSNVSVLKTKESLVDLTTGLREGASIGGALGESWGKGWNLWSKNNQQNAPFVSSPLQGSGGGEDGWKTFAEVNNQPDASRALLPSGILNSPQESHTVAAARDVERVTKLLSTPRGLRWVTHNAENSGVSRKSKAVFSSKYGGDVSSSGFLKNLGSSLLSSTKLLGLTETQIGFNGTGAGLHVTNPYGFGTYLGEIAINHNSLSVGAKIVNPYLTRNPLPSPLTTSANSSLNYSSTESISDNAAIGGKPNSRRNQKNTYRKGIININDNNYKASEPVAGEPVFSQFAKDYYGTSSNDIDSEYGNNLKLANKPSSLAPDTDNSNSSTYYSGSKGKSVVELRRNFTTTGSTSKKKTLPVSKKIFSNSNDKIDGIATNDESLIDFSITPIYASNEGKPLKFQANLESYSDSFTGNWGNTQYVGRAENLYNYTGFDRKIQFKFTVVSLKANSIQSMYSNLNSLVGAVAPTYSEGSSFMKGTLVKVTIGNLITNQYGFFTSINLSLDSEAPWEIDQNKQVPHILSADVSFTPIHNFNVVATGKKYFGIA